MVIRRPYFVYILVPILFVFFAVELQRDGCIEKFINRNSLSG